MLVIDSSVAVHTASSATLGPLDGERLVAPPLLWSEVASALRGAVWRGSISASLGAKSLARFLDMPIERRAPRRLYEEAWRTAEKLGWAKTYDAEYVALARILSCRLVTVDARLRRGGSRVAEIIGPEEL
ncbi:MAG TPA: type II toxin-antitoxin system VapC family toxin [Actinomycetota bacterium]